MIGAPGVAALGVLDQLKVVPAPAADDALLGTVHTPEYIAAVKRAGDDPDRPVWEAITELTGGSYARVPAADSPELVAAVSQMLS